jgi:hypothetical protein
VFGEDGEDVRREGDGALAGLRLWVLVVGDLALQQLRAAAADTDCSGGEVDVLSVKADDLASAEAGPCGDEDGRRYRGVMASTRTAIWAGVAFGRSLARSAPAPGMVQGLRRMAPSRTAAFMTERKKR